MSHLKSIVWIVVFAGGVSVRVAALAAAGDAASASSTPGAVGDACSTTDGRFCGPDTFCKHPPGTCDAAGVTGTCTPIASGCPRLWDPVCGCDDVTYANECEADAAAVSIAHRGPCERLCGGVDGIPCDDGEFCQLPVGDCCERSEGICTPIPPACPDNWDPVCGCDGVTYGNRCEAAAAGASLAHTGVCEEPQCCDPALEPGQHGNPICIEGATCCADGQWRCNDAGGNSTCDRDGEVCPQCCDPALEPGQHGNPICIEGATCCADGQWRCNDAAGNSTCDRDGEVCPPCCDPALEPGQHGNPICIEGATCCADGEWRCNDAGGNSTCDRDGEVCPRRCGGIVGIPCEPDEFCKLPDGDCCCDVPGVCVPIPPACPLFYDPVCGCDGETYGNECEASAAGVSIDHRGPCERVCGGIAGIPCGEGEFCELPDGECCCDVRGVCVPIPDACPRVWDPVCGCDGETYGNACEARAAAVSIDHRGPCERVCGGIAGIPCDPGEFCRRPDGDCFPDALGACVPIPRGCPDVWDPVCGCDGITYGNDCEAVRAGSSIAHRGPCRPRLVSVCPSLGIWAKRNSFISSQSKHVPLDSVEIQVTEVVRLVRACTRSSCGLAPEVEALIPLDNEGLHVVKFSHPIRVGEWTTVTLIVESGHGAVGKLCFRLGHLPDDIDKNGQVNLHDATWFGWLFPHGPVKVLDLDGNGEINLNDATKFGQIWRGTSGEGRRGDGTGGWLGAGLPDPPPCGCD